MALREFEDAYDNDPGFKREIDKIYAIYTAAMETLHKDFDVNKHGKGQPEAPQYLEKWGALGDIRHIAEERVFAEFGVRYRF